MHHEVLTANSANIYPLLPKFRGFYLAGGTALALQLGHRVSVDFDLFSDQEIPKQLLDTVRRVFRDRTVLPSVNNAEELTVIVDSVKVTFLYYPFPLIDHLVAINDIQTASILEIAAMKAYTIGRRALFKDYIDLYAVLSGNHLTIATLITSAQKKYGAEFNDRLFLEQLIALDDVEAEEILFLKEKQTLETTTAYFEEQVRRITL